MNDCISFVNETYFRIPFEKLTFSEGDCLKARVLYVQPTTKTTYLTLRSLETVAEPKLKNGDLIKATVTDLCFLVCNSHCCISFVFRSKQKQDEDS